LSICLGHFNIQRYRFYTGLILIDSLIQYVSRYSHRSNFRFVLLLIPIALSAFTHLWNLDGFPSIYRDEDHYLRKTLHVLSGLGPQEKSDELLSYPLHPYTHPYFGQLFLAAILGGIGYPDSINPSVEPSSIKEIFLVPRMLIGILAILDTFLLFKITERRYGTTTAVIASVLFAVMPLTWLIRRIWLEPIQLPFLLASILVAMYLKDYESKGRIVYVLGTVSGVLFGLAIFTKIPIFTLIPLIIYVIYSNSKNWKLVGTWLAPVVLIPLLWPLFAILNGEYDQWVDGLLWQSERENMGITGAFGKLFAIDPVLMLLTLAGTLYAVVKARDLFIILWFVPFILFNLLSGYVSYWHPVPLFPAFCIGSAILISKISKLLPNRKIGKVLPYVFVLGIGTYGLIVTIMLVTLNLTSFHYQVISGIANQIQNANTGSISDDSKEYTNKNGVTVLGTNYWLWIPKYIFDRDGINEFRNYYNGEDIATKKVILVVGKDFVNDMTRDNHTKYNIEKLRQLLTKSDLLTVIKDNQSNSLQDNKYPFNSLTNLDPNPITRIEIHTNY